MATPPNMPKPALEDPLQEREIFATEVIGVGAIHGNVTITLGALRFDEPTTGNQPKARRIVTARLILTNPAAAQLLKSLQGLVAQLEAATAPNAAKSD
jgi:hypothetical protein